MLNRLPPYVIFWVTSRCNARCKHCYNWAILGEGEEDLRLEEIKKIFQNFGHIKYLTLGGGEPSLRDDLADIASLCYTNNGLQNLKIITNGLLPDRFAGQVEEIVRSCPGLFVDAGVSLDALGEEHDTIRGVKGTFNKAVNTIKLLKVLQEKYKNFVVSVCSVCFRSNQEQTESLFKFVNEKLGVRFYFSMIRADVKDKKEKEVDINLFQKIAGQIARVQEKEDRDKYPFSSIKHVIDELTLEIVAQTVKEQKMIIPCKAGKTEVVLTNNGEILPCELLGRSFGNLRDYEYDIARLLKTEKIRSFLREIQEKQCFCTWECIIRNNIVFSPRLYPQIFFRLAKKSILPRWEK
ncbi:MAG: radical SAM protein [Deltaproteobacteria bacterium]|nr:MAG: radical SAM protein [Deltaproteobacteria bacterium]